MRIISPKLALIALCNALLLLPLHAAYHTDDGFDELEIISVTATKLPSFTHESPHSVSQISQQTLENVNPQHINQALSSAPGTWISRGNGQEHLTAIRSPVLTGAGSCGAFFVGIDGIPVRSAGFCNANQMFDLPFEQASRIEVLRSPSSTLYGSNAVHGVVNLISADPFNADSQLSFELGAYDFVRASGQYSTQNDTNAFTIQSNITRDNGYQVNSGYDQQKLNVIHHHNGSVWQSKTLFSAINLNQETAGFIQGFDSYKDETVRRSNPNPEAFRDAKSLRLQTQFKRDWKQGELRFTPFIRYNQMAFLQHFLPWKALEKNGHRSLGFQSLYHRKKTLRNGQLGWLVGSDFDFTRGWLVETQNDDFSPSIPAGTHYDYSTNATQLSLYAQTEYTGGNWQVSFGSRLESIKYDYNNHADSYSACADSVAVCRFVRPDDQTRSFTNVSSSASALYSFTQNLNVYAKLSQGYRAPQVTELFRLQNNQEVADIDNESINAVELGLKFKNEQVTAHLAWYDFAKRDVIFQNTERQNVTGAATDHSGLEFELRYRWSPKLFVNGHISYAKHLYASNSALVSSNIKGNQIDTAPNWMSKWQLNYQAHDSWLFGVSWQYMSEYYLDPQNSAEYDGHHLIDAFARYSVNQRLQVQLNMFNLADNQYAERADFAFGNYRYFVGQARRVFLNLRWQL